MNKIIQIAWREFRSVVFTKGFLLGILLPPLMAALVGFAIVMLKNADTPRVQGRLIVVDRAGKDGTPGGVGELAVKKVPEALEARRKARSEMATKQMDDMSKKLNLPPEQLEQSKTMMQAQADMMVPQAEIKIEVAPPDADIEQLKAQLSETQIVAKGEGGDPNPLLGVVVIGQAALTPGPDGTFGLFDLFVAPKLDVEIQNGFERGIGEAIIDARVAGDPRVKAAGLDAQALRAMLARPNVDAVTMTKGGGRKSIGELQMLIPMGFMILMMLATLTTGQYLMTTVIEEKSSRVMEVLLSAVSPMQLMVGKIIGHMSVGVLIIGLYGGVGITGLVIFALTQLVTPLTLLLLICYFIVASVTMAAMMAAIGSAVNELREAQTLMTPVMMLTMLPWMIWFFIQRAPNSNLATGLSFVPVMGPFVMVLRLGGSEPVPAWQHPVALLVGAATALFVLWAAAKIFRIGVLMFGKPPNFRTLIRWVRMA